MSYRAWAYVYAILAVGGILTARALLEAPPSSQRPAFAALIVLATLAQLFKAEAPNHQLYYTTPAFFFAGLLLLSPSLFVLLVIIALLIEWVKERLIDSPHLRAWYLQPFNVATYIIAGLATRAVYVTLDAGPSQLYAYLEVFPVTAAALTYVMLNHFLVGLALVLARGVSWHESRILALENLLPDFVLLSLGYIVAVLWPLNPWLILLALSPLMLISRALAIPQLKKEAQTDGKTGLWNARHFATLFTAELERARRFNRPLALIMADLDLLRNINNTYGHLAGDVVLAAIGGIIRQVTREYDIAGRFGGEEFAIVLPETGPEEARLLAERLRRAVEAADFEVSTSSTPIHATMSLGLAHFPLDATTATDLIHEADIAVYQAKLKGRNCVVSASDVPQSFKLENSGVADRLATPYVGGAHGQSIRRHDVASGSTAAAAPIKNPGGRGRGPRQSRGHPPLRAHLRRTSWKTSD